MEKKVVINKGQGHFELSLRGTLNYLTLSDKPKPYFYMWDGGDWYRRIEERDALELGELEQRRILLITEDRGERFELRDDNLPEPAFFPDDTNRHDPNLIRVVEILGDKAGGRGNRLEVVKIDEYEYRIVRGPWGREDVITPKHSSWAKIPEPTYNYDYYGYGDYDDWD